LVLTSKKERSLLAAISTITIYIGANIILIS
jgi:hypothetical protein